MLHKLAIAALCSLVTTCSASYCQSLDSATNKILNFPSKFFSRITSKASDLNQQLTQQTEKYLQQMARQEDRLRKKLGKTDSAAAARLFANSAQQYAAMLQKFKGDTAAARLPAYSGTYQPNLDTLSTSLSFLRQNPQLMNANQAGMAQQASTQLQQLQAKMQGSAEVDAFIQQRKAMIQQYLSQYTNMPSALNKQYQSFNSGMYYYAQRVQQYKDMLNSPDKMETQALAILGRTGAYQNFVQTHSQMATLFGLPGNTSNPSTTQAALTGLQTKDQMQQIVKGKIAPGGGSGGGAGGMSSGIASLNQYIQSAKSKISALENNIQQYGTGGENIQSPDFKPNDQKTRTFWGRLEYGFNMQTSRTNYAFPTTTDLGFSLGYKLNKTNSVGIGASYKIGWGSGINDIAISGQGVGLRSFVDIRVKGSWSVTGGLEYNYETPFNSFKQIDHWSDWSRSGLIGVSKTVSVKSRVLKKTSLQLLWDFLSYYQNPGTQPFLFRIGYGF
jgi:hypothetical protein